MRGYLIKYGFLFAFLLSLVVFLFSALGDLTVHWLDPSHPARLMIIYSYALLAAVTITVGVYVFDPVVSEIINVFRKIIRFESLSNPLLLRLSYEAPGTFYHSINVSLLAQKAAKSIGANSLLIRTAAYYHDIGKLDAPTKFIENQSGQEIPQSEDSQSIRKNAEYIISHVQNGVEIAKKNGLPEDIIDLISSHHGTARALYFYEKAKEKGLKIKKTDFRYAGPIPTNREGAILMLADQIEAAARALPALTLESISELVRQTIVDKKAENQFKKCRLREDEYEKISRSFTDTLHSIYHQRIEIKKT